MLRRLCNALSYELNLKRYYKLYAACYALDGIVTSILLIILWLYVPMAYYVVFVAYNAYLDASIYVGETYLGLHPDALIYTRNMIAETIDVTATGNTLIVVWVTGSIIRCYMAYQVYLRGQRESDEKV